MGELWILKPMSRPKCTVTVDGNLRYFVPSNTEPTKPPYLVELDAYNGNGCCDCKHFQMRLEPLLTRRVSPEAAVRDKLVELRANWFIPDALRCIHILTARGQFLDDLMSELLKQRKQTA